MHPPTSSLARLLHLSFPLPFSLPVVCIVCWSSHSRFRSILSFLAFSFSLYLLVSSIFPAFSHFYLSPSFRHSRALHRLRSLATLRVSHVAISFLFSRRFSCLSFSFILSGEFLIIESRRDRKRLARTWKYLRSSLRRFRGTQLYLICVPLATPRSFYRAVDFDGFIRTLYSQSLYSRDLKSLIMGATGASARWTS